MTNGLNQSFFEQFNPQFISSKVTIMTPFKYTSALIICLLLLASCSQKELKLSVTEPPRFVDDPMTDNLPLERTNYPDTWDPSIRSEETRCTDAGSWVSGMDWQMAYLPKEGTFGQSERIIRRVEYTRIVTDCNGNQIRPTEITVAIFNPARSFDVISVNECTEYDVVVTWQAEVGIIDLNKIPRRIRRISNFRREQNVKVFLKNGSSQYIDLNEAKELEDEFEENILLTWNANYSYKGCDNNQHNWSLNWDSGNSGGGRNANRPPRGQPR